MLSCAASALLIEIVCGPITAAQVLEEVSFICSLFLEGGGPQVSVMYGVGSRADIDRLWRPQEILTGTLPQWIERSIEDGVYEPARSDICIVDRDRLTARLCHEADIHIETRSRSIVQGCADRWLAKAYRLLRSDQVPPSRSSWREILSAEEATAGLV